MATPDRVNPEPMPPQYRVLRSFSMGVGVDAVPGSIITIGPEWPYHRASDLARLRYLEPIAPTRGRGAT